MSAKLTYVCFLFLCVLRKDNLLVALEDLEQESLDHMISEAGVPSRCLFSWHSRVSISKQEEKYQKQCKHLVLMC